MKIERITPLPPTHASDVDQILRAGLPTHRRVGTWTHAELDAHRSLLPQLLPAAESLLEDRWGIVCSPGDYRLTFKENPGLAIILPLHPVTALSCVTRDEAPTTGWVLKNNHLSHPEKLFRRPEGKILVAIVRAGYDSGLPHLVKKSLALICRDWIKDPSNAGKTISESTAREVGQLLAVFVPALDHEVPQWL